MRANQIVVGADRAEADPTAGFRYPGEFLMAVQDASRGRIDRRLLPLRAAVGDDEHSTFSDPHGGFLLPIGFSPDVLAVERDDPLQRRVRPVPMDTPSLQLPARSDKNHSAGSVSGGLVVMRREEPEQPDSSRGKYDLITLQAHSLIGLSYATNSLVSDSPRAFSGILAAGFEAELSSTLMEERLRGTGVGQFLGVLAADCTITVDKEVGQQAGTLLYQNVRAMRTRCWRYSRAVWLANYDTQDQLQDLQHVIGDSGERVYQYAQREEDPDMLLGRPIFYGDDCEALGTRGDLVLGTWSEYLEGTLSRDFLPSVHVRFAAQESAFKFWIRNDGRPWWLSPLTPKRGANTLAPFVVLESRT